MNFSTVKFVSVIVTALFSFQVRGAGIFDGFIAVDEFGKETTVPHLSIGSAMDMLDTHRNEDPSLEFRSLKPISFKDPTVSLLSGTFQTSDKRNEINLHHTPEGIFETDSCISSSTLSRQNSLSIRGDGRYYAILKIASEGFARITWTASPIDGRRILMARIYKKKSGQWSQVESFEAREIDRQHMRSCRDDLAAN